MSKASAIYREEDAVSSIRRVRFSDEIDDDQRILSAPDLMAFDLLISVSI